MIRYALVIFLYLSISSAMGVGKHVSILLDHSGSMEDKREFLIQAVNDLFDRIREIDPKTTISLYTFNDDFKQQINKLPVSQIAAYTDATYPSIELGTKLLDSLKKVISNIVNDESNNTHKIYAFTDGDDEDVRYGKIKKDFLKESMQKTRELNIDLDISILIEDETKANNIAEQLSEYHIPREKITIDTRGATQNSLNDMSLSWSSGYQHWSTGAPPITDSGIGTTE